MESLAILVGGVVLAAMGAFGGYRYEAAQWKADTKARDLAAAHQQAETDRTNATNIAAAKKVNDEALQIQSAQSAYIASFLQHNQVRRSAVPTPTPSTACPAQPAVGPGSGSDNRAPKEPFAFQDPDITGVALAGWEQLRLWREWCRATPGCVGPEVK